MGVKRKICVITGTRAEYGLLFWLFKEMQEDPAIELQIVVTGTHLSPEFGLTHEIIEKDGFKIDARVEMLLSSDTPVGVGKSIGLGVIGFSDALDRLKPDMVVVLGDRFEILAAVLAAMTARIPVSHLHGGEVTEGAVDEAIRHSITKMSHLHFTAAEEFRRRVIQLGEAPEKVFNFGAIGLDNIHRLKLLDRDEFEEELHFLLGETNFLITYHPETLNKDKSSKAVNELLAALDYFPKAKLIFTRPNADAEGREIAGLLDAYTSNNPDRARVYTNLGQVGYLSAIKFVDVVIGNSSSGLYEAPVFKKPTVNIGNRQHGRLQADSVINCPNEESAIVQTIQKALSPKTQQLLQNITSPYYSDGQVSVKVKEILKKYPLDNILMKGFHDLNVE